MRIVIDDKSGFCFGVVKAIQKAEKILAENGEAYSLGDIVHNRIEVSRLGNLGLSTISYNQLEELSGKSVIIRAHGEPPSTYEQAQELNITIIDATCPVVAHLQKIVKMAWEKMQSVSGQVVILGKRGHAEVVGLTGQVGGDAIVVESIEDMGMIDFERPIYLLSQTTQSLELFDQIKEIIYTRMPEGMATINDTICRQVSNRNPHLREFASQFDVIIFVSGHKSSNGKALFEVCRSTNPRSHKIEEGSEIIPEWFTEAESVGICGATSTPKWLMEQIAEHIQKMQCANM